MQFVAASVVVAVVVHLIYVLDVTLAIAARPQPQQRFLSPLPPLALLRSLCVACEIRQAQIANGRQRRQEIPLCIGVRVCVCGAWEGVGSAGIGNWDLWPLPMGRLICDSRRLLTHR